MDATAQKAEWPWYVRFLVGRNPVFTLVRAVVWALLIIVMFKYVFIGVRVRGDSMEPTFRNGQIKFVNRLAYLRAEPKRGDIVAIRAPGLNAVILKRIVALPGEQMRIRRGKIHINGKLLDEPYATGLTSFGGGIELEPNQYWLIGDNREISDQYVKFDYQILGKVVR